MWLFGYGSLVWKAGFPFKSKTVGFIKGYVRRFYQASTDHRGVPEKPGRVVTLLPSSDPSDVVWGVAYEIAPENIDQVLEQLDYREKCGYDKSEILFYPKENPDQPFKVFLYIASTDNGWFLGEAQTEDMARQIVSSVGPSGPNTEYLFQLAAAMREMAPEYNDKHLFDLETAVKNILSKTCNPCSHG